MKTALIRDRMTLEAKSTILQNDDFMNIYLTFSFRI
jgi:hypothetical protein